MNRARRPPASEGSAPSRRPASPRRSCRTASRSRSSRGEGFRSRAPASSCAGASGTSPARRPASAPSRGGSPRGNRRRHRARSRGPGAGGRGRPPAARGPTRSRSAPTASPRGCRSSSTSWPTSSADRPSRRTGSRARATSRTRSSRRASRSPRSGGPGVRARGLRRAPVRDDRADAGVDRRRHARAPRGRGGAPARPGRALLLVAGDVDAEAAIAAAGSAFGDWSAGGPVPPPVAAPVATGGPRRILVLEGPAPSRRTSWSGTSASRGPTPDACPGPRARDDDLRRLLHVALVQNLREEKGYTYSPGARRAGSPGGHRPLLRGGPDRGDGRRPQRGPLRDGADGADRTEATDEEMERAFRREAGSLAIALQTAAGVADGSPALGPGRSRRDRPVRSGARGGDERRRPPRLPTRLRDRLRPDRRRRRRGGDPGRARDVRGDRGGPGGKVRRVPEVGAQPTVVVPAFGRVESSAGPSVSRRRRGRPDRPRGRRGARSRGGAPREFPGVEVLRTEAPVYWTGAIRLGIEHALADGALGRLLQPGRDRRPGLLRAPRRDGGTIPRFVLGSAVVYAQATASSGRRGPAWSGSGGASGSCPRRPVGRASGGSLSRRLAVRDGNVRSRERLRDDRAARRRAVSDGVGRRGFTLRAGGAGIPILLDPGLRLSHEVGRYDARVAPAPTFAEYVSWLRSPTHNISLSAQRESLAPARAEGALARLLRPAVRCSCSSTSSASGSSSPRPDEAARRVLASPDTMRSSSRPASPASRSRAGGPRSGVPGFRRWLFLAVLSRRAGRLRRRHRLPRPTRASSDPTASS